MVVVVVVVKVGVVMVVVEAAASVYIAAAVRVAIDAGAQCRTVATMASAAVGVALRTTHTLPRRSLHYTTSTSRTTS